MLDGTGVTLFDVVVLSSLEVVLSLVLKVLSKELNEDTLVVAPTLHEGITNAVNKAKALKTCLFFITP